MILVAGKIDMLFDSQFLHQFTDRFGVVRRAQDHQSDIGIAFHQFGDSPHHIIDKKFRAEEHIRADQRLAVRNEATQLSVHRDLVKAQILLAKGLDRHHFLRIDPIFHNLLFHRLAIADHLTCHSEDELEHRGQMRGAFLREIDLVRPGMHRQHRALEGEQVGNLRQDGQNKTLGRIAIEMHVHPVALQTQLETFPKIIQPVQRSEVLRAGNFPAFRGDVDHVTYMAGFDQCFLHKGDPDSPAGAGRGVGTDFKDFLRFSVSATHNTLFPGFNVRFV